MTSHSPRSAGRGTRTVVGGPTDDIYPSISPNGRFIAFQRTAQGAGSSDGPGVYVVPLMAVHP